MDHLELQLTAAEVQLTDDMLDAIDTIVAPGVTVNPADDGWVPHALAPNTRRPSHPGRTTTMEITQAVGDQRAGRDLHWRRVGRPRHPAEYRVMLGGALNTGVTPVEASEIV
jgi:hypothetical protein